MTVDDNLDIDELVVEQSDQELEVLEIETVGYSQVNAVCLLSSPARNLYYIMGVICPGDITTDHPVMLQHFLE